MPAIRLGLYGLAVGLLALGLWSYSLQGMSPLPDAAERFVAMASASDEAAAAARRSEGEQAGVAAARAGQFAVYEYGLPAASHTVYRQLLLDRYGVEVHNVGCMPVADKWDWQVGFTQATKRALRLKYGHDVFEECRGEARRLYDARVKCE